MKAEEISRDLINSTPTQISSNLERLRYNTFLCENISLAFKYYNEDRSRYRYLISENGIEILKSQLLGKSRKFTLLSITN